MLLFPMQKLCCDRLPLLKIKDWIDAEFVGRFGIVLKGTLCF